MYLYECRHSLCDSRLRDHKLQLNSSIDQLKYPAYDFHGASGDLGYFYDILTHYSGQKTIKT